MWMIGIGLGAAALLAAGLIYGGLTMLLLGGIE